MGYRDLNEALEARRGALGDQLRELEEKTRSLEDLRAQSQRARRELAQVDAALGQRRLPMLDRIQVASPCSESWDGMTGDERQRFCGKCQKHVYNLSAMTSDEAEALIFETEGRICARFYRREDGTVLTADCSVGRRRKRRRWLAAVGLAAAAGVGASAALAGTATMGDIGHFEHAEALGAIAPMEPAVMGSVATPVDPPPAPIEPGGPATPTPPKSR